MRSTVAILKGMKPGAREIIFVQDVSMCVHPQGY